LGAKEINIQTDDSVLVDEFKNGSRLAYNLLVQKYQKRIYWVIRKMVLDHDDANDIAQDVFIKIYTSLHDFRGDSQFFTYIYRIAVNFSINHINKNKRLNTGRVDIDAEAFRIHDHNNRPGESYDDKLNEMHLETAIGSLPDKQRAVFNLRYYDGMSYEEISKIMDTSVGGLKANYFHAVKKIQEYFTSNNIFDHLNTTGKKGEETKVVSEKN
jgi:RNA polymerase sigma factor (sigma-70 family)